MAQRSVPETHAKPETHDHPETGVGLCGQHDRERKISTESGFGSQSGSRRESLVGNEISISSTVLVSLNDKLSHALQTSRSTLSLESGLADSTANSLSPSRVSSKVSLLSANGRTDCGACSHGPPDDNRSSAHELSSPEVIISDYDQEQQTLPEGPPHYTQSDISKDKRVGDGIQGSPPRVMKRNLALSNLAPEMVQMQLSIPQSPVGSESDNESTSTEEYFSCEPCTPTSEPMHSSLESNTEQEESSGSIHREDDISPDRGRQSTALQDEESSVDHLLMSKVAEKIDGPTGTRLGVLLHVDPFRIKQIQSEYQNIYERNMRILRLWEENTPGNQKLKLAQVIKHIGLGKLAMQIDATVDMNPGPDTFLNPDSETLSPEEFDEISREVRDKWQKLAIQLQMPRVHEVIRDIEEKSGVPSLQAFWLLWRWWYHDVKVTREHLADALRNIGEIKLALRITGLSPELTVSS